MNGKLISNQFLSPTDLGLYEPDKFKLLMGEMEKECGNPIPAKLAFDKKVILGMSSACVRASYGIPEQMTLTNDLTQWTYAARGEHIFFKGDRLSDRFSCSTRLTCDQIGCCSAAKFYYGTCGYHYLDGDDDGIPCESKCK